MKMHRRMARAAMATVGGVKPKMRLLLEIMMRGHVEVDICFSHNMGSHFAIFFVQRKQQEI
ncbi:hypothetical protein Syun_010577 [Stephania yunnanensis]|uniref:Uncharacterized protein n=1 Tax=Stephania yunnanensis TaxID=152371 RepID=A0AAP0KIA7_9MAGN